MRESKASSVDRSRVVWKVTFSAVNCGWTCDELFADFMRVTNEGGAKVREIARTKGETAARSYVRANYEKAVRLVRQHPAAANPSAPEVHAVRQGVDDIRRHLDDVGGWQGKSGATALAVFTVHLMTAARVGRSSYSLDRRSIAAAIPCHDRTVTNAHRRLIGRGLLRCNDSGRGHVASSWTIPLLETLLSDPILSRPPIPLRGRGNGVSQLRFAGDADDVSRDAFIWAHRGCSGLGLSKRRVADHLGDTAVAVQALATVLGSSAAAVRKHLRDLEREGLAVRTGRLWRRGTKDAAAVAVERGTAGATARRRRLNAAARSLHRAGLALGYESPANGGWNTASTADLVALVC